MRSGIIPLLLGCVAFFNTHATILNVPASFSTIQSAINASSNGDTVAVSPGTYYENLNFRGKNILLTSLYYLSSDTSYLVSTIINGSIPADPDSASCVIFNPGEDSTAILQGFTITGGSGTKWLDIHGAGTYREGGGILVELSSPTIRHNIITNNSATNITGVVGAGGGGLRVGDGNPGIYNNVISFNQGRYGAGIVLNYTGCKISNNIIFSNTGGENFNGGSGIWIYNNLGTTPKIIENNTIIYNNSSLPGGTGGVSVWAANSVLIRNNIIWGNLPGPQVKTISSTPLVEYCDVEGGYSGTGNIDLYPDFIPENYYLSDNSICVDSGDPATAYNDPEDPQDPGHALFPSKGLLRNDIGAYGGPNASLFPIFQIVTAIPENEPETTVHAFPNPFSSETTIKNRYNLKNVTIKLYNVFGIEVKKVNNISGQEVKIQRDNLPAGIYLVTLIRDNQIVAKGKLIISD